MSDYLRYGQFYGEMRKASKFPGLVLTETIYPPRLRILPHSHENAYFCFILQGSYTEVYGAKTRDCTAFTLAFHPPAEVHSENFDDSEVHSFNVEIEPSRIDRIRQYSRILDTPIHLRGGMPAMIATRLYSEFRSQDDISPLAIEGLFLELLSAAERRSTGLWRCKSNTWLKRAKDLLHARFGDSMSLSEIAAEVGVHPVYLAREFRRCFRCTIGDYVRQLRIEHACRALNDTDAPLKEVALDAGFFDQSHFCRVFRKYTGMTPNEYRSLKTPYA
jgi:AraC family transcriptional regulator